MRAITGFVITGLALLAGLFLFNASARADDASSTVSVKFPEGDTKVSLIQAGTIFSEKDKIETFPDELAGLMFTSRPHNKTPSVSIDAPAGTIYLLFGNARATAKVRSAVTTLGGKEVGKIVLSNKGELLTYKLVLSGAKHLDLNGAGVYGVLVAAAKIEVLAPDPKPASEAKPKPEMKPVATPPLKSGDDESTTKPAMLQTSIKSLEVYTEKSGMFLGATSEVILTLTPGRSQEVNVKFVSHVGDEMRLATDEAMRYARLTYPKWDVNNAEFSFEDKYNEHDGGSIGAAVGTMLLSVIQGMKIDSDVAITGDISANGKVRAIGGIGAKLRGAASSKCTFAAVPTDNYDQLMDAVVYFGPSVVSDVQVIGISTLDDAIATVRIDREEKLKQAMDLFAAVQQSIKTKPDYLKSKAAQTDLAAVLAVAPQHLSAKILLARAEAKTPPTLSAAASEYYAAVAVQPMLAIINERAENGNARQIPSTAIKSGLLALKKLRPMADVTSRPLIDDWANFVEAVSDLQEGSGSAASVERRRQTLLDEMTNERSDPDMMQKRLKQGI